MIRPGLHVCNKANLVIAGNFIIQRVTDQSPKCGTSIRMSSCSEFSREAKMLAECYNSCWADLQGEQTTAQGKQTRVSQVAGKGCSA